MNILQAITLAALLHHAPAAPAVTCHTGTVSYKFAGTPGATFTYAGAKSPVPPSGWIELLADGGKVYLAANGRSLPLEVWPIDAFGTRTVPVQPPATANENITPNTINN